MRGIRQTRRGSSAGHAPPGLQPLEPRTLLSATLNAEFIAVDNTPALTGYTTADLRVTTTTDWTSASLLLELSQGSIYQDASGGIDAPNPAQFGAFPTLEFDTYLDAGDNAVFVAGGAGDVGGGAFRFDTAEVDALWFDTAADDTGTLSIGRFTLTDNAAGTWSLRILNAAGDVFTDSGSFTQGNLATPVPQAEADENDFTGDAKPDILWRNIVDGRNTVWQMDGINFLSATAVRELPNLDWQLVGVADFTGDGENDILWRNTADGRNTVWQMDGTDFQAGIELQPLTNPAWRAVGVADFTGDGWADILWRNTDTGKNTVWEMAATTLQAATAVKRLNNFDWQVVGVSDFTGDTEPDILWHNNADGRNLVWEMDGTGFQSSLTTDPMANLKWRAVMVSDFTGDGDTDILWRHVGNGRNTVWEMNGTLLQNAIPIKRLANPEWQVGVQPAPDAGLVSLWKAKATARQRAQAVYTPIALQNELHDPVLGLWEPY